MKSKRGPETARSAPTETSSVSRHERASATMFVAPDLHSTVKTKSSREMVVAEVEDRRDTDTRLSSALTLNDGGPRLRSS